MRKIVFLLLLALIIISAGIWYINNKNNAPSQSESPTLISQINYLCNGGRTINAAYYKGAVVSVSPGEPPIPTGSVKVVLSDGRSLNLPQTISASGVRYANSDESFVFWNKGDAVLVLENNTEKDYTNCLIQYLD